MMIVLLGLVVIERVVVVVRFRSVLHMGKLALLTAMLQVVRRRMVQIIIFATLLIVKIVTRIVILQVVVRTSSHAPRIPCSLLCLIYAAGAICGVLASEGAVMLCGEVLLAGGEIGVGVNAVGIVIEVLSVYLLLVVRHVIVDSGGHRMVVVVVLVCSGGSILLEPLSLVVLSGALLKLIDSLLLVLVVSMLFKVV